MNLNCIHTENHTIICETCKIYVCPDCVVDKFNSHRQHSLVTPNGLVERHKKFIQDSINKFNTDIETIDTEIKKLTIKKNQLSELDSDKKILLSFLNTTSTICTTHNSKSYAICCECNVCACVKCLIDPKCIHRDHKMVTIEDKIIMLADLNEKTMLDAEKEINVLTLTKNRYITELNAIQTIVIDDSEIIKTYLANNKIKINDQMEMSVTENTVYELDYAFDKCLKWSLNTELITENSEHELGSGYYMVIAVGGGASGGIFRLGGYNGTDNNMSVCGGECGEIVAKILKITHNTKINIQVGKCGSSKFDNKKIDNHEILCGSDTKITFDDYTMIATGGDYRPGSKWDMISLNTGQNYRGIKWRVGSHDKFDVIKNNIVLIDKICNIFPVVYTGLNISTSEDIDPHKGIYTSGASGIKKKGDPGDSGICLANISKIFTKDITVPDNIKIKGFGSGGHGSSLYYYNPYSDYIQQHNPIAGSDGANGCVIIVYLQ